MIVLALLTLVASADVTTPAPAPSTGTQDPWVLAAPLPEEQAVVSEVRAALAEPTPVARATALDKALGELPQPTRFRGLVQCLRSLTLRPAGRAAEAPAATAECYRLDPDLAFAQMLEALQLIEDGSISRGATLLATVITTSPQVARGMPADEVKTLLRRLSYANDSDARARLVIAVQQAGIGADDPSFFSDIARETMADRLAAGDTAGALALLPAVTDPSDGLKMLIDRRYQPIWPQLEGWAGRTLDAQRDAAVRGARAAYDLSPDLAHRNTLAAVLDSTGHADEAIALLRPVLADPRLWDDERYDAATVAVHLSRFLGEQGTVPPEQVVAPMRIMLDSGTLSDKPALWNIVPNLASDLIALGHPDAAVGVLDKYVPPSGTLEAQASYGYFAALRGCALQRAGKQGEARVAMKRVITDYAENDGAVAIATFCIGDDDAKVRWIEASLADSDRRDDMLLTLARADAAGGVPSGTFGVVDREQARLAARADVRAAFDRVGRTLPASFTAALLDWRTVP